MTKAVSYPKQPEAGSEAEVSPPRSPRLFFVGESRATAVWAEIRNPYDGAVARVAQGDPVLMEQAVRAAHKAFSKDAFSSVRAGRSA